MSGKEIAALNFTKFWSTGSVSYSYVDYTSKYDLPSWYADDSNGAAINSRQIQGSWVYMFESVSPFSVEPDFERSWTRDVLDYIQGLTQLTFDQSSSPNDGAMIFGRASLFTSANLVVAGLNPGISASQTNSNDPRIGDVWINENIGSEWDFRDTILHELGHALGLSHPSGDTGGPALVQSEQTLQFTAMATRNDPNNPYSYVWAEVSLGFQLYDIAALQHWYSENKATNTGDDTYGLQNVYVQFGAVQKKNQYCIWDGGGIDTISAVGANAEAVIDLREGRFSSIHHDKNEYNRIVTTDNLSIAFGCEIENAAGSDNDDLIIGNYLDNKLEGGKGNDFIFGDGTIDDSQVDSVLTGRNTIANSYKFTEDDSQLGSGEDTLYGGDGKDQLWGGLENDFLYGGADEDTEGDEEDKLYGGDGDDLLVGGRGNDTLQGGEGTEDRGLEDGLDTADYSSSKEGIKIDLIAGIASDGLGGTDKLLSIEGFIGSAKDDEFKVTDKCLEIDGGKGNDTVDYSASEVGLEFDLTGEAAAVGIKLTSVEIIAGTNFADVFRADERDLRIDGGTGNDIVDYSQASSTVTVDLAADEATFSDKTQELKSVEGVIGSAEADKMYGDDDMNLLLGRDGDDTLKGGAGMDILIGDDGADVLYGDDDEGEIDYLDGGAGADKFYVGEGDIVLNFNAGDKIYLNDVLLTGGENFSQWAYDNALDYEKVRLPFVDENGVAYTFVDTGFGEGSAMAVMTSSMTKPVIIFGVELSDDSEAVVRTVSSEEKGSWESAGLVAEGGLMKFTRWDGIDHHIPELDPIPEIPGYAKDLYDWQVGGGVPGEFSEEGTWDAVEAAPERAILSGHDGFSKTWDQQVLLATWGSGATE